MGSQILCLVWTQDFLPFIGSPGIAVINDGHFIISRSRNNSEMPENKGAGVAYTLIFGNLLGIGSPFVKY